MTTNDPIANGEDLRMQFVVAVNKDLTLGFTFRHIHLNHVEIVPGTTCTYRDKTHCTVYKITKGGALWEGCHTAYTSELDVFNKATGRKWALTRALLMLNLDKDARTKIWGAYWDSMLPPKPKDSVGVQEAKNLFINRWVPKVQQKSAAIELDSLLNKIEAVNKAVA